MLILLAMCTHSQHRDKLDAIQRPISTNPVFEWTHFSSEDYTQCDRVFFGWRKCDSSSFCLCSMLWALLSLVSGISNDIFSLSFSPALIPSLSLFLSFHRCFSPISIPISLTLCLLSSILQHFYEFYDIECLLNWRISLFHAFLAVFIPVCVFAFLLISYALISLSLFLYLTDIAMKFRTLEATEFIIFHFLLSFPMTIDTILCDKHTWHNHGNQSLVTWAPYAVQQKSTLGERYSFSERNIFEFECFEIQRDWIQYRWIHTMIYVFKPNGCLFFFFFEKISWNACFFGE